MSEWLKPVADKPGTFKSTGVGRDLSTQTPAREVEFVPFYRLHRRLYAAYWDLFTPAEYDKKIAEANAEKERIKTRDAATVVSVDIGNAEAEKKVNQQGEESTLITADGRRGRRAAKWFSYDLPVEASAAMALVVTYNSDTRRTRSFEILVEGQRVGEQTIAQNSAARFFDVEYPIPAALITGKPQVTVRFQATNGNETAPVFGVRVIRAGK